MPKGYYEPLTTHQEVAIKDKYLSVPVKRLARDIGTSPGRIIRFLKRNNLEIPPEVIATRKLEARFKKGSIPANKGKKITEFMTKEAIAKFKSNSFKKGHKPHNTKYDGAVVSRKDSHGRVYKYIRMAKGKWVLFHRYLWEKEVGEIPEDKIIVFKDGDTENLCIGNLEMVSKPENMYRNSVHNYPKEVIPSLLFINQLEKKLKDIENG